jgi:quercetin dioxygenase-like cupin family protein
MAYRRHRGQGGTNPHGGVPSGRARSPHRHPGWQFIYVLEGKVVTQIEGEPAREYEAGQAWYEARDHLHQNIGNPSPDTWAKILVFYLTEPGQPVLVFEEERDAEAAEERNDR